MFYNLFTNIASAISDMVGSMSQYLKCRSLCCNNINIYNPSSCCIQGEIFNKWTRCTTPGAESPQSKRGDTAYFTPKNK